MRALDRKLLRELGNLRLQLLAIILVLASGVASYVSMLSAYDSLARSQDSYYAASGFADVWATASTAPASLRHRILEIPGVAQVETRVVQSITLDLADMPEPATGRLLSMPAGVDGLNRLHLRAGRWPEPGRSGEALVNEAFANVHQLVPGDALWCVMNGRREQLRIVGIALSPEYVYSVSAGSPWPDDKRAAILWMDHEVLADAFAMRGAFNDVTLALGVGASERDVIAALDRLLAPWGGASAHGRSLQSSHRFLADELQQLQSMGKVVPVIFLGVAAFLLNAVLSRIVGGQREQIAALKALGYGNLRLGIHYAELALVVVAIGSAIGLALGGWLGDAMVGLYRQYFRFPNLSFALERGTALTAVAISTVAGVVGALAAVRSVIALPPAEAMRPPLPARYRRGPLSRALERVLSQPARMVARNLARNPVRSLLSSLGIAFSIAIIIAGSFSQDALVEVMDVSFQREQRYDVQVAFRIPLSENAVRELRSLPGVLEVEGQRAAPVRLHAGANRFDTAIVGMPEQPRLRRLLDDDLRPVTMPARGLVVTDELARRLGVQVGDVVEVEVLEGRRHTVAVEIAGLSHERLGLSGYMRIEALHRLLGEGPRVTGALLAIDPHDRDATYLQLKRVPAVASVGLRSAVFDIFNETTAKMQTTTTVLLAGFASIIAIGVVYNGARITLVERSRELATLRVIGFTRAEVSGILLGELGVQLLLAVPLGWLLGWLLALGVIQGVDAELFRFPLMISPRTYLFATAVVVIAGLLTALSVRRKIDRLDLVEVLKTRE